MEGGNHRGSDYPGGDDTYSEVGYYQQLSGDQYSVYDPITGTTETETVPDNVRRIPRNLAGKWRRPASGYTWSQQA